MNELALFAGAGGGILGSTILGWRTICAVEINAYAAQRLMQRQNEGHLPPFPIWDDVCTFDGTPWKGYVDVVSGGFPCQDISSAGKRSGIGGKKSGLWKQMARIIGEVNPQYVLIENSKDLKSRGLDTVLTDLAAMGYDARWGTLSARETGAPHLRKRLWIVANSNNHWKRKQVIDDEMEIIKTSSRTSHKKQPSDAYGKKLRVQSRRRDGENGKKTTINRFYHWWPLSIIEGMDDGVAHRMDRCRATGEGQVPRVVALAWNILSERFLNEKNDHEERRE
jgi:DNA (cytosine-5)-methyltransferase 1